MDAFKEWLSTPWLGTVLGVLGIVIGVVLYLRSKQTPRLACQIDEVSILGGASAAFPREVEIRFAGVSVARVTAARVVLWNAGKTTLRGEQIVQADPLRLALKQPGEFLKVDVVRVPRPVNAIVVDAGAGDREVVRVQFDFMDPGDGVTLEILHSGPRGKLSFFGTMRGLPRGISDYGEAGWKSKHRRVRLPIDIESRRVLWVMVLVGALMTSAGIFWPLLVQRFPKLVEPISSEGLFWPVLITGVIYTILPLLLLWLRRRRYPATLEPSADEGKDANLLSDETTSRTRDS